MTLTTGLQWVRQRQRDLTRVVLALFVLAWLQAAALPCVMAHSVPTGDASAVHYCPYCPPVDAAHGGCDDQGNCAYPHDPQMEARTAAAMFVAVPASMVLPFAGASVPLAHAPRAALTEPIPRIPISVDYCRFIE